ncbi:MAG: ribosome biogenesis GTPase Der [Candidatus Coatesbacteria bacterium]|nr:ribosome biogenesis GTPase Der [Candidatus Coatesbacteria bacterium]
MLPLVAIVGRTNVGKSTLFNRLIGRRLAIVDALPGVTRDRMYADAEWPCGRFSVVDTGGWDQADPEMRELVDEQRETALDEAELILFVVDAMAGPLPEDREIADRLRTVDKPLLVVANKADNERLEDEAYEFYDLGLDAEVLPLSAKGKRNWGRLLEVIGAAVGGRHDEESDGPEPVAIIGRPNSGKSSLVNALVGENRLITSQVPGTTRDAVSVPFSYAGRDYLLVDTAGLRRRKKVRGEVLERLTVVRALEHIRRSRLVVMLVDVVGGLVNQDAKIIGYALERGRAAVIAYNKLDLVEADDRDRREIIAATREELGFAAHVPVVFLSALTGRGLKGLMKRLETLSEAFRRELTTREVNDILEDIQQRHQPPSHHGREVKLHYGVQTRSAPPKLLIFLNREVELHFSYQRFIENRFREAAGWQGVPLELEFRAEKRRRR